MPLSAIGVVRSLIGDMLKVAVQESVIEKADGVTQIFQLDMAPMETGSETILVSGRTITSATGVYQLGTIDFSGSNLSGSSGPTANAQVVASYNYFALSDDEIQGAIDLASGNGSLIAGAIACRKLAANFSRWFSYVQGDKSVDKRFVGRNLLVVAESLEKSHETTG